MSFFSDINGFNKNAMSSNYETKNGNKTDFSEVDFCVNEDEKIASHKFEDLENIFKNNRDLENIKEDYMYNYDITEEEAEEYINKHFTDEG